MTSRRLAKLVPYLILTVVAGAIWLLALASHNAGNDTAINALVGIPMGLVMGFGMIAAVTWGLDD